MDAIEALVLRVDLVVGRELTRRRELDAFDMALAGRLCGWTGARTVLVVLALALDVGRDER